MERVERSRTGRERWSPTSLLGAPALILGPYYYPYYLVYQGPPTYSDPPELRVWSGSTLGASLTLGPAPVPLGAFWGRLPATEAVDWLLLNGLVPRRAWFRYLHRIRVSPW